MDQQFQGSTILPCALNGVEVPLSEVVCNLGFLLFLLKKHLVLWPKAVFFFCKITFWVLIVIIPELGILAHSHALVTSCLDYCQCCTNGLPGKALEI